MSLLLKFESHLKTESLISYSDTVWVACSGGPDSVGLFHLLVALREKWNLRLGLLHFNHRLRGRESRRDEQAVQKLAKQYGVPLEIGRGSIRKKSRDGVFSLEEAARRARYDFFVRTAKRRRIQKMATAHTQDDQAETVLMRVLQGTGLRGLLGIRAKIEMRGAAFIRPLLSFRKKEILDYLNFHKISFRRDSTNLATRFLRNRIRRRLLPMLEREFNPRVVETLARIPSIARDEYGFLESMEKDAFKKIFRRRIGEKLYLDRKLFARFPPPLKFRILERALKSLDPQSGVSFTAWARLQPALSHPRDRVSLPRDIDLFLTPSRLLIYKKFPKR